MLWWAFEKDPGSVLSYKADKVECMGADICW